MTRLKLDTLAREPEFHLDELLALLEQVPDGFGTMRGEVRQDDKWVNGWFLSDGAYVINVNPEYQCGFDEEGDGKVLTVMLSRIAQKGGQVSLTTTPRFRDTAPVEPYFYMGWRAGIYLGEEVEDCPTRRTGLGFCDKPGTAVLVAYLMAWGMVE